jgi:cell division protein FtsN
MLRTETCLGIIGVLAVFTATIVAFIGVANIGTAQGQTSSSSSPSSSLTPEQKDAICNPNSPTSKLNPVNTTESKICGIPKTVQPKISNGTDTGAASPSVVPTPPPEEG